MRIKGIRSAYPIAFMFFGLKSGAYQKGYMKGAMQTILDDQMAAGTSVGCQSCRPSSM
jgi:ABC-type arginine/histidine transport system permease subunit